MLTKNVDIKSFARFYSRNSTYLYFNHVNGTWCTFAPQKSRILNPQNKSTNRFHASLDLFFYETSKFVQTRSKFKSILSPNQIQYRFWSGESLDEYHEKKSEFCPDQRCPSSVLVQNLSRVWNFSCPDSDLDFVWTRSNPDSSLDRIWTKFKNIFEILSRLSPD